MIHEVAHQLEHEGFGIVKKINDQDGTVAYWLNKSDEDFILVTKEYSYQGLASFMKVVVEKAANHGFSLLFYEDKNESLTVFDASYYNNNADLSHGKSKKSQAEWLELPLKEGVSLTEHLSGSNSPTTMAGDNETLGSYT